MRRRVWALVGPVLTLAGCSFAGEDPQNELVGHWAKQLNAMCIRGLVVEPDGTYESDVLCHLDDGTFATETELGDYALAGNQISFTPTQASCPSSDHAPEIVAFEVDGNLLTLALSSGTLQLGRVQGPFGGSNVAVFGCHDLDAGQFTEHDLEPL